MKNSTTLIFMVYFTTSVFCHLSKKEYSSSLGIKSGEWHNKCLIYTGVSEDLIEKMKKGKFPEDMSIKRYNYCLWTLEDATMDKDLKMDPGKIEVYMPPKHQNFAEIFVKCNQQALGSGEKDPVELIWKMQKCIHSKTDEEPTVLIEIWLITDDNLSQAIDLRQSIGKEFGIQKLMLVSQK